jgi:nicotinamidase-related amidase
MAPQIKPEPGDVLIITDMQNCFLPGGSLPVTAGDSIIGPLNTAIDVFAAAGLPVIFTRDWHPPNHCSFRVRGGPWPPHCVQDTEDAAFSRELHITSNPIVISKALDPDKEQYSAYHGRDEAGATMADHLRRLKPQRVFIGGVATEYCVFNTVLDMLKDGYHVSVFQDGVKPVDVNPGDGENALETMEKRGARLIRTGQLQS